MRLFLALLLLTPALAGCVGGGDDPPDRDAADGAGEVPTLPEGLEMEGAEIIATNETSITFRWMDQAEPSLFGGLIGGPTTDTTLEVPPDDALVIEGVLVWDDPGVDLDLVLLDGDAGIACESREGSLDENDGEEACVASANPGRETRETWTVKVESSNNPRTSTPFKVELEVYVPFRSAVDAAVADRFGDPVLVGTGADAESTLFIGEDGTMLACAHGGFRKPSPLWASHDGGANWGEVRVEPNPVPSGDCDVSITEDGTWYMLYATFGSITVASSTDEGQTWQFQPLGSIPVVGRDRPWLLPDGDEITMTYQDVASNLEPAVHMFTRSTDQGRTWPVHKPMGYTEPPERPQKLIGRPINWDDGQQIIAPVAATNTAEEEPRDTWLQFHRSEDTGTTWTTKTVLGPVGAPLQVPGAARALTGTVYLSYATGTAEDLSVHVVWSEDDGASWTEPVEVASNVTTGAVIFPWIDARPDGSATLAWLDYVGGDGGPVGWQVRVARVDAQAPDPIVFEGGITEPVAVDQIFEFISVDHDAQGRARILYVMEEEGCAETDPPVDPRREGRSLQCVYLISEEEGTGSSKVAAGRRGASPESARLVEVIP